MNLQRGSKLFTRHLKFRHILRNHDENRSKIKKVRNLGRCFFEILLIRLLKKVFHNFLIKKHAYAPQK